MKYNEIYSLRSDIACAFTFPHFIWPFLLCPHCLHPASCGFYFHSVSWVWGPAQELVLKLHRDKKTQLHRTHCGPLDPGNSKPSLLSAAALKLASHFPGSLCWLSGGLPVLRPIWQIPYCSLLYKCWYHTGLAVIGVLSRPICIKEFVGIMFA